MQWRAFQLADILRGLSKCSMDVLVMGRSAIHIDRLAGDKVTVLRGQKNHRPRQVRGLFTRLMICWSTTQARRRATVSGSAMPCAASVRV